jgi:hypothetical protein
MDRSPRIFEVQRATLTTPQTFPHQEIKVETKVELTPRSAS